MKGKTMKAFFTTLLLIMTPLLVLIIIATVNYVNDANYVAAMITACVSILGLAVEGLMVFTLGVIANDSKIKSSENV